MDTDAQRLDTVVRARAFDWVEQQTRRHGDVLPRKLLLQGFEFQGRRVPLISAQQGIFKPAVMPRWPLSILSSPDGPYDDGFLDEHHLLYRYRGTDPQHRDNVGLREAMELRLPLLYLFRIAPGRYLSIWPVFVIGDNPGELSFTVVADYRDTIADRLEKQLELEPDTTETEIRRRYLTSAVRRRVHQSAFRERVLEAYQEQCAMCRLRHRELLDASHIIPDREESGVPEVSNGLALCKIHHAAFDSRFVGVRPDYRIEVRADILEEQDGPMLRHGLQGLHGASLQLPRKKRDHPNSEALERRYSEFLDT
jgi:putative restriction endonuclease